MKKTLLAFVLMGLSLMSMAQNHLSVAKPSDDSDLQKIKGGMTDLKKELRNLPSFSAGAVKNGEELMVCFPDIKKNVAAAGECLKIKYDFLQSNIKAAEDKIAQWEITQKQKMESHEKDLTLKNSQIEALKKVTTDLGSKPVKETISNLKKSMAQAQGDYRNDLMWTKQTLIADVNQLVKEGLKLITSEIDLDDIPGLKNFFTESFSKDFRKTMETFRNRRYFDRGGHRYSKEDEDAFIVKYGVDQLAFNKVANSRYSDSTGLEQGTAALLKTTRENKRAEIKKIEASQSFSCFKDSPTANCKSGLCASVVSEYLSKSYGILGKNVNKFYGLLKLDNKNETNDRIQRSTNRISSMAQNDIIKLPPADFTTAVNGCGGTPNKSNISDGSRDSTKEVTEKKSVSPASATGASGQ